MLSKKSFSADEFFSLAGASHARRPEGAHQFPPKRSQTFVAVLKRLAAAERAKNRSSRDFRSRSTFDFFDSIGQTEKNSVRANFFRVSPCKRTLLDTVGMSQRCQGTKSLRSSPLRGSKSRETGSRWRGRR